MSCLPFKDFMFGFSMFLWWIYGALCIVQKCIYSFSFVQCVFFFFVGSFFYWIYIYNVKEFGPTKVVYLIEHDIFSRFPFFTRYLTN